MATTPHFLSYTGDECVYSDMIKSHFFSPVSRSRATIPPRFLQSPNSRPINTRPRSGATAGEEPTQSASIKIHFTFPAFLSKAETFPSYEPKYTKLFQRAGEEKMLFPLACQPPLYFQTGEPSFLSIAQK